MQLSKLQEEWHEIMGEPEPIESQKGQELVDRLLADEETYEFIDDEIRELLAKNFYNEEEFEGKEF